MNRTHHGLRALLMALCLHGAQASDDSPRELDTMTVRESSLPAEPGATVHVLTLEALDDVGVTTLAEALGYLPGIHVRRGKRQEAYVRARGLRQREVLILIDGIPVNSPYSGQFDLDRIPVSHVERIVYSKGAASVTYGTGSPGGVINIITRAPEQGPKGKLNLRAEGRPAGGTKVDGAGVRGMIQGSLGGPNLGVLASLTGKWTEGYPVPGDLETTPYQTGGLRANSDSRSGDLFVSTALTPTERDRLALMAALTTGSYGAPPMTVDTLPAPEGFTGIPKTVTFTRYAPYRRLDMQLRYHHDLTDNLWISPEIHYAGARTSTHEYAGIQLEDTTSTYDQRDHTLGARVRGSIGLARLGKLEMALGGSYQQSRERGRPWAALDSSYDYRMSSTRAEGGVSYTVGLGSMLGASVGLGGGLLVPAGREDVEADTLTARTTPRATLFPQLALFCDLPMGVHLYGSYGKAVRFPSLRELYEVKFKRRQVGEKAFLGDPDLATEHTRGLEAGLRYSVGDVQLSAAWFHVSLLNMIEKVDSPVQRYANIPAASLTGLETRMRGRVLRGLEVDLSYTFVHTLVEEDAERDHRDELQYRPAHRVSWILRYSFPFGLQPFTDGLVVSKQYFYEGPYKYSLPAYALMGLGMRQELFGIAALSVGVRNLFDRTYYESYALPRPGRTWFAGLTVEI